MASTKSWIKAMRLRTLPLAVSSTLAGSFMAISDQNYDAVVIALAIATTLLLQILSNLANDLGDSLKGTDNKHRIGPTRTVQSGEISVNEMKWGVGIASFLTLVSGILLIFISLGTQSWQVLFFLGLGLVSITAAIKYTVGRSAYGYQGLGDLFVFIFFGLTGVLGTYYLNAHTLPPDTWLMAISVGLLSTGVLNLNNMRDIENDKNSGKNTIVVRIGTINARIYHGLLVVLAIISGIIYTTINYHAPEQFIFLAVIPLFIKDLLRILKIDEQKLLDPYLKKLAISTFAYILLFGIGILLCV
jgi:1,4-dihydroxy-2-naphthoate octaprenyltransferase